MCRTDLAFLSLLPGCHFLQQVFLVYPKSRSKINGKAILNSWKYPFSIFTVFWQLFRRRVSFSLSLIVNYLSILIKIELQTCNSVWYLDYRTQTKSNCVPSVTTRERIVYGLWLLWSPKRVVKFYFYIRSLGNNVYQVTLESWEFFWIEWVLNQWDRLQWGQSN